MTTKMSNLLNFRNLIFNKQTIVMTGKCRNDKYILAEDAQNSKRHIEPSCEIDLKFLARRLFSYIVLVKPKGHICYFS